MAVDRNDVKEDAAVVWFCKIVLGWDYFRLLRESKDNERKDEDMRLSVKNVKDKERKDEDMGLSVKNVKDKERKDEDTGLSLKKVKNTYKDIDDYLGTFEPLLFEEVKAQITQKREDEEATVCIHGATVECTESGGFHLPKIAYKSDEEERISQNDLLLLSDVKYQVGSRLPIAYAFALVEYLQPNAVTLKMYLAGEIKQVKVDEIVSCPRLLSMRSLTSYVGRSMYMLKICSLSTILREYVALRSVSSLPFKDLILTATHKNLDCDDRAWKIPGPLMESIKANHNDSQLAAIFAGLSRRTFVLIQGPPGTGKTQTILGLLSAILHATPARVHSVSGRREQKCGPELAIEEKYRHWGHASPWLAGINPRDAIMPVDGDDGFFPTSGNVLKPEVVNSSRKYRVRVLVCAPSNSALDEIVLRVLSTGVRDENDRVYNPKIVRIGLKPHHSVEGVSMDYLVKQRLAGMEMTSDKWRQGATQKDVDNVRSAILEEAVIVFSTLSFSGSTIFTKSNHVFDVVIIDEAAQAVEPATLVPLANKCKQVFLVGDPVQLPATVISSIAKDYGYGTSLFKRFQKAGYPVQMLKTQYRMHPEIRSFPSKEFYNEALEDGLDVQEKTKRDWHAYRCFGPFCFFDIHEGNESQLNGSGSWENADEVNFIVLMYHKLVTRYPTLKSSSQLAIISPYRNQVKLFRDRFKDNFGVESQKVVDINTIDGFQGREKDVAIFSCVRANKDGSIGFLSDDLRRMNVGITRAKSCVLVVGSASTLKRNKHWNNLIESAEKRNSFFKVSKPYASFFSDENLKSMQMECDQLNGMEMDNQFEDMRYNAGGYGNAVNADRMQEDGDEYEEDGRGEDGGAAEED